MTAPVVVSRLHENADDMLIVSLTELDGHDVCDVRVFVKRRRAGDLHPTRKGVAVRVDQIPALRRALEDAEGEARRRGLLRDVPAPFSLAGDDCG